MMDRMRCETRRDLGPATYDPQTCDTETCNL